MVTAQQMQVAPSLHGAAPAHGVVSHGVVPHGVVSHAVVAERSLRRVQAALLQTFVIVALYELYAYARDRHGRATEGALGLAQSHGRAIADLQAWLRLPDERTVQAAVLPQEWLVRLLGGFYGTAHFVVTLGVLGALLVRRPHRLAREGAVLAVATFVALGIFALYPVAPPRLMPPPLATVDTLATVGGVWSYDHGVLERISDPYAAMPSLHVAWATWVALVAWRLAGTTGRPALWRILGSAHLAVTLVAVIVTGVHWYLDAAAGAALVLAVAAVQQRVTRSAVTRGRAPCATAAP